MSELSSEKQLELLGDIFLNTNKRYLLVSNTGRLLEGMAQVKSSGPFITLIERTVRSFGC